MKDKEAEEVEKKELQHPLEEASIKIEVERIAGHEGAAKVTQWGYQCGHEDCIKFFFEFIETLAPNYFHQDGYFEAYVKYIENRHHTCAAGKDLKQVEFQSLIFEDDDLEEAKDTTLLDGEAVANEGSDDEAVANEGSNDEDQVVRSE